MGTAEADPTENKISNESPVGRAIPVSYTHLDVYKRQIKYVKNAVRFKSEINKASTQADYEHIFKQLAGCQ